MIYVMSIFQGLNNNVNLPYINRMICTIMIEKCEMYKQISKNFKPLIGIMIPESYSPLKKLSIFYNAIYHGFLFGWQYDLHINFKVYFQTAALKRILLLKILASGCYLSFKRPKILVITKSCYVSAYSSISFSC